MFHFPAVEMVAEVTPWAGSVPHAATRPTHADLKVKSALRIWFLSLIYTNGITHLPQAF